MDPNLNNRSQVESDKEESFINEIYAHPLIQFDESMLHAQNGQFNFIEYLNNLQWYGDEFDYALHELEFQKNDVIQEPKQDNLKQRQLKAKTKTDETNKSKYQKRKVGCSCTKKNCTSKYCCCLKEGYHCSTSCECEKCQNKEDSQSKKVAKNNQPKDQKDKGCKCKQRQCLKGYCDCFANNIKCTTNCQCSKCNNREPINKNQEQNCEPINQNQEKDQ